MFMKYYLMNNGTRKITKITNLKESDCVKELQQIFQLKN